MWAEPSLLLDKLLALKVRQVSTVLCVIVSLLQESVGGWLVNWYLAGMVVVLVSLGPRLSSGCFMDQLKLDCFWNLGHRLHYYTKLVPGGLELPFCSPFSTKNNFFPLQEEDIDERKNEK